MQLNAAKSSAKILQKKNMEVFKKLTLGPCSWCWALASKSSTYWYWDLRAQSWSWCCCWSRLKVKDFFTNNFAGATAHSGAWKWIGLLSNSANKHSTTKKNKRRFLAKKKRRRHYSRSIFFYQMKVLRALWSHMASSNLLGGCIVCLFLPAELLFCFQSSRN